MALESASFLNDLAAANPPGGDPKNQGDDHIRLMKAVLQATFPGMAGAMSRVQAKAANYTVVANDNTSIFRCSAAITLNLTAVATLGNKHSFAVYAEGGDVTLDPNAAELINGVATVVVPRGSFAIVWCDGASFVAAVLPRAKAGAGFLAAITGNTTLDTNDVGKVRTITATATVTLPDSTTLVVGDTIKLKSLTTGNVQVARGGADTIDGSAANYRLPSFETIELQYVGALTWVILVVPRYYVGQLIPVGFSTVPAGFVLADNAAINRTTFAGLFAAISTTYGVGDGSTTFNTPDTLGRTLIGAGTGSGLTARANAAKVGVETHPLTIPELAVHTHVQDAHTHTINTSGGGATATHLNIGLITDNVAVASGVIVSAVATNQNTGSGTAHQNMQPSIVATYMVKT